MFEDTRLKVFMAVAKNGSFTAAAREIGISQPAVSQNVAELEKEVGEPLFDRQRGAARLTDKGKAFLRYAGQILRWYGAMDSAFGPSSRISHRGEVRVQACPYCTDYLLPKLVSGLRLSSPDLKFIISPYNKKETNSPFDFRLFTRKRTGEADLLNTATLRGTVRACAVSSSPADVSLDRLPEGKGLAVWSPYLDLLPDDDRALSVFVSESPAAVESAAAASENIIGLLPFHEGVTPSLSVLPIPLPHLQTDLHIEVSEEFSASQLYSRIESMLQNGIF